MYLSMDITPPGTQQVEAAYKQIKNDWIVKTQYKNIKCIREFITMEQYSPQVNNEMSLYRLTTKL